MADELLLTVARYFQKGEHTATRLIALDANDGARRWIAELAPDILESGSSPVIDPFTERAYFASDHTLYALALQDGSEAWRLTLANAVVNASPLVTDGRTQSGAPANRLFITDFGSGGASLYAVNVNSFHPEGNPYEPGEIVWSAPIGSASGATPTFEQDRVVVTSYSTQVVPPGLTRYVAVARCFSVDSGGLIWQRDLGLDDGFFGGATLTGGAVYAATYDFFGGGSNSRLIKLSLSDGAVIWTIACERTASIPIVLEDGRILLSGGIVGFGSSPHVQCFRDLGGVAELQWQTTTEFLGGWNHQPALIRGRLWVQRANAVDPGGPPSALCVLDLARTPTDPGFMHDQSPLAGANPAVRADGWVYSIGSAGVSAFRPPAAGDCNCDDAITVGDIGGFVLVLTQPAAYALQFPQCDPLTADLNADGAVTVADIGPFVGRLLKGNP